MAIRRNLVANLVGSAWTGVVTLAFIPVYLRYIGAEGYGLVGFFVTIGTLLAIFDGGFGAAAARELARTSHLPENGYGSIRNLIRTLEWTFWVIACALGSLIALLAPAIASHWLNLRAIDHNEAVTALRLMGLALILQWPIAYYSGCLIGLQRQVGLNLINSVMITAKFGGAALVLVMVSPTVIAFFIWQAAITLVHVGTLQIYLWQKMPGSSRPQLEPGSVRTVGRFALGVGGINVLALILTQLDKVILSNILPLDQFGYYTLASTLATVVSRVVGPIFNATYPRFTQLVAKGDAKQLAEFFHNACQLMALAVVPLALLIVVFGREIVLLWTGDSALAEHLQWVVALLALGTLFNGLVTIPYALQLASGWTRLAFWQNVIAVILLAPATIFLARRYSIIGAASVWAALNLGYVLFSMPAMFSGLLHDEKRRWYLHSMIFPIVACAIALTLTRDGLGSTPGTGRWALFSVLAFGGLIAQTTVALVLSGSRTLITNQFSRLR